MDSELQELAERALVNAFWFDFSSLVNKYLKAAKGLDVTRLEMQLGDHSSVYGRDNLTLEGADVVILAYTPKFAQVRYGTLTDALNDENVDTIYLQGNRVFQRKSGEWAYCEYSS